MSSYEHSFEQDTWKATLHQPPKQQQILEQTKQTKQAKHSYKTVEGRNFLAAVREAIRLIDEEMEQPSSIEHGKRLARIISGLELCADRYDLFGEKDRRQVKP